MTVLIATAAVALTAAALAAGAVMAYDRIRAAWRRQLHVPGLPVDGEPLSREESAALAGIAEGLRYTEPERSP